MTIADPKPLLLRTSWQMSELNRWEQVHESDGENKVTKRIRRGFDAMVTSRLKKKRLQSCWGVEVDVWHLECWVVSSKMIHPVLWVNQQEEDMASFRDIVADETKNKEEKEMQDSHYWMMFLNLSWQSITQISLLLISCNNARVYQCLFPCLVSVLSWPKVRGSSLHCVKERHSLLIRAKHGNERSCMLLSCITS